MSNSINYTMSGKAIEDKKCTEITLCACQKDWSGMSNSQQVSYPAPSGVINYQFYDCNDYVNICPGYQLPDADFVAFQCKVTVTYSDNSTRQGTQHTLFPDRKNISSVDLTEIGDNKMNIGILYTGGTIGCTGTPLKPLSEDEFEKAFTSNITPIIQSKYSGGCTISFIPFGASLDSTNLQPSDWCRMASDILTSYSLHDAFIILHGTDTMAWTASALSFLLTGLDNTGTPNAILTKPVIVTGSQLPLFYQESPASSLSILYNTDALQNVCGSVAATYTGIPEVCLYFNNKLFRGNRTVKTNASQFNAFSSPNYPYLGEYGVEFSLENRNLLPFPHRIENKTLDNQEALQNLTKQLAYIKENINKSIIIDFQAFPVYYDDTQTPNTGVLSDMLNAYITDKVKGIILESYGEGNFPSGNPDTPEDGAIYKTLEKAHNEGVVLVDCTQVLTGIVNSEAYASGSWLSEVGAVGAFDMTPIAALAKLIYLTNLSGYNNNNWIQSDIERLMKTNIAGEIMDINKLDSRGKSFLGPGEYILALDGSARLINDFSRGPILEDKQGTQLWAPPIPSGTTGQLYMQEDTNLVFYDRSGKPVWATNTAQVGIDAAALVLDTVSSSQGDKDNTTTLTLKIIGTEPGGELYSHIIYPTSIPSKG